MERQWRDKERHWRGEEDSRAAPQWGESTQAGCSEAGGASVLLVFGQNWALCTESRIRSPTGRPGGRGPSRGVNGGVCGWRALRWDAITSPARSPILFVYREHPGFLMRIPKYHVTMGFGLHYGWAIEGAIGSEFKIDASSARYRALPARWHFRQTAPRVLHRRCRELHRRSRLHRELHRRSRLGSRAASPLSAPADAAADRRRPQRLAPADPAAEPRRLSGWPPLRRSG